MSTRRVAWARAGSCTAAAGRRGEKRSEGCCVSRGIRKVRSEGVTEVSAGKGDGATELREGKSAGGSRRW
eukprot:1037031-Pleurochrysis_carterae.AAC.1